MKTSILWTLVMGALLFAGCAVHTPEVTFTGERTALEKQILGSYRLIEEDTWELSSVRAAGQDSRKVSAERLKAIEAFANRLFNADDVEDFKRDEVIGENARGFLTIRSNPKVQEDAEYQAIANRILSEENRDRQIILQYLMAEGRNAERSDSLEVYHILSQLFLDASPPGTWIQKSDSSWTRK